MTASFPASRPRRNRRGSRVRAAIRETTLGPQHLVLPLFVHDSEADMPIPSLPGRSRQGIAATVDTAREAAHLGLAGVALFPALTDDEKDSVASASTDPDGLLPRTVRAIKEACPDLLVITDVACDPYSSAGHDGLVRDGEILNDETLPILAAMAITQARAGADVVAPSDMMDGRIGHIRQALDAAGFSHVAVCSYCVKYASSFYGPFRDALDSAPRGGDKKTYQMDPANVREAQREVALDEAEGADWLMVKPGMPYLDVVRSVREQTALPVAAYHVSGEYAMLRAAAANGWLDYDACLLESLTAFRRAGADVIFSYGAIDAARLLNG